MITSNLSQPVLAVGDVTAILAVLLFIATFLGNLSKIGGAYVSVKERLRRGGILEGVSFEANIRTQGACLPDSSVAAHIRASGSY